MDILSIFDALNTYDTSHNHLQSHAYTENNGLNIHKNPRVIPNLKNYY